MQFQMRIKSVGNTSLVYEQILRDASNGNVLWQGNFADAFVKYESKRTKSKSAVIPASFKEVCMKYCNDSPSTRILPPDVPEHGCFVYRVDIMYSDTDLNRHSTMSSYVRFCLDCADVASRAGHYRLFLHNPAQLPVKTHQIVYKGESFEGDTLEVHTWEVEKKPDNVLYFAIMRQGSLIVHCSFEFHEEPIAPTVSSRL